MTEIKRIIPNAAPSVIPTDFESASMSAFSAAYPMANVSGCYCHLCQNALRKLGMDADYENDNN